MNVIRDRSRITYVTIASEIGVIVYKRKNKLFLIFTILKPRVIKKNVIYGDCYMNSIMLRVEENALVSE